MSQESFTLPPGANPWGITHRPGAPVIRDEHIAQAIAFVNMIYQQGNAWSTSQYQRLFDQSVSKEYRRDILDIMKACCHSSALNILERLHA